MNYTVLVYDEANTLAAKIENATTPQYSRSKNSGDQVSFSFPRGDNKESEIVIGRRFEIVRYGISGNVFEASGYISEHGYSGEMFEVGGFTEEVILGRYLTPNNYGYPLWSENATLDALFDEFGKRYHVERIKGNWDAYDVESSNIDFTSNPTFVLLQGSGTPTVYPASGYVVFRFQKASTESWERIRWVSDYDEEAGVTTTVQYRQGSTPGSGSFTSATAGALTDVVGLVPSSPGAEYMDVRINFATSSEETSPVLFSLEVVKSEPIPEVDSVVYPGAASTVNTPQFEADNRPLLDVIIDVCEEAGWEFKLEQRVLEFGESLGVSRLNDYSLVES